MNYTYNITLPLHIRSLFFQETMIGLGIRSCCGTGRACFFTVGDMFVTSDATSAGFSAVILGYQHQNVVEGLHCGLSAENDCMLGKPKIKCF
jgi:hypothetical protein